MENTPEKLSPLDHLIVEKKAAGWDYVGYDQLRETKFNTDGKGLFKEVAVRTEEEIREKHRKRLIDLMRQSGVEKDVEIDLVAKPKETLEGIEIPDKFGTLYIFARVIKPNK